MTESHAYSHARTRPFVESGWVVSLETKLASTRKRRLSNKLRGMVIEALRQRDGDGCCFGPWCLFGGQLLDFSVPAHQLPFHERPSIEHLDWWYRDRVHRLDRMALAHSKCNQWAGKALLRYLQRERRLERKAPRIRITAWPALTYADQLDF